MATEEGFCPFCEVTLDLHDGPDSCDSAQRKADLLNRFAWMVVSP